MANVLIVYFSRHLRPRSTVADHLYSFRRHSKHRVAYLNAAAWRVPHYFRRMDLDAIFFHYSFLSQRMDPPSFSRLREKTAFLKDHPAKKIVLPQDEYIFGETLSSFIDEYGVSHVFSLGDETQWPVLYPEVDRSAVQFDTVLTGYLDDRTVRRIERITEAAPDRPIDIGYRSWDPWPCLGRHGRLKGEIGRVFLRRGREKGLNLDISNNEDDAIFGDDWFRFLARCKYTIGVEGGASILDYDGSITSATREYLAQHPSAGFDEVEAACFPGRDGSLHYVALSPRHLEACATRTCQILVEGSYNGVLVPGEHYVELKRDFSNIDQVLDAVCSDAGRAEIVERAYRDVVESGRWSYRGFVEFVLGRALPVSTGDRGPRLGQTLMFLRAAAADRGLFVRWFLRDAARVIIGPDRLEVIVNRIKRWIASIVQKTSAG